MSRGATAVVPLHYPSAELTYSGCRLAHLSQTALSSRSDLQSAPRTGPERDPSQPHTQLPPSLLVCLFSFAKFSTKKPQWLRGLTASQRS